MSRPPIFLPDSKAHRLLEFVVSHPGSRLDNVYKEFGVLDLPTPRRKVWYVSNALMVNHILTSDDTGVLRLTVKGHEAYETLSAGISVEGTVIPTGRRKNGPRQQNVRYPQSLERPPR